MALPLPRAVTDVGPGGGIVTAMGGMNSLANDMLLRKINAVKAQYAPLTTQADAASKLAYANLMAPQFISKLLGNEGALANMSESQKRQLLGIVSAAGINSPNPNSLNQRPEESGGQSQNSGWFANQLKGILGGAQQGMNRQQQNPLASMPSMNSNPQNQFVNQPQTNSPEPRVGDAVYGDDYDPEFEKAQAAGFPVNDENQAMELTLNKGQKPKTWAENTGLFKGKIEQGKEAGKYRAKAQQEIGESQLGLSHSGAVLDRMTKIIKNPAFQEMRSKIPFFQDKQLSYLMKTGTPEQKKLIGDFLSTAESFIASTVQGFGGRPLVREFDLAQRQKITSNDPVHVAEGKLQAAISLHDIAEKKNDIISNLLDKGVSEADAVKRANKMVDVSAIEKRTEELLRDKPTAEDIEYMAKKRGISTDEVKKLLKAKGLL